MCRIAHTANETDTRMQAHVDPLLSQLASIREAGGAQVDECFAIMGVTMIDLYSSSSDLFVAGMAAGASNVAVFSFARYHPCLKMSPEHWFDYSYVKSPSNYSYFEDAPKKRPPTKPTPPSSVAIKSKMLFRACKLLVHEMMHIYGIDHCIYHECIMKGTGHLVEDFSAPIHLCPIDLRKMQFRLGFDVAGRYRALFLFYTKHGWKKEAAWTKRMLESLNAGNVVTPL